MRRVTGLIIALSLQAAFTPSGEAILDVYEVTPRNIKNQPLPLDVQVSVRGTLHDVTVVATFDSRSLDDSAYVIGGALDIPGVVSTPVMSKREGDTLTWQFSVGERLLDKAIFRIVDGVRHMPSGSLWNVQLATFLPGRQANGHVGALVALPVVAGALIITVALVLWRRRKAHSASSPVGLPNSVLQPPAPREGPR